MQVMIVLSLDQAYQDAVNIRKEVFINEQKVPPELEIDEFEDDAVHFVAYDDGKAVGAGRMRLNGTIAKAERICVLSKVRGRQVGRHIMDALEDEAKKLGADQVLLHAQTQAIPFYEKLEYEIAADEEFMDAGIPHKEMYKKI